MSWLSYEHHVAGVLRDEGWSTSVTPQGGDGGVDVIAERAGHRMAVQVKKYGSGTRKVNAQAIRELYGAAAVNDCALAMLATDGDLLPDAHAAAAKLGVEIRRIPASPAENGASATLDGLSFDTIWRDHVRPLEGRTVTDDKGRSNLIITVDDGGVIRRTSGGTRQRLDVEIFRWTVERLLAGDRVTQQEINDRFVARGSAGVIRILTATGLVDVTQDGRRRTLRLTI